MSLNNYLISIFLFRLDSAEVYVLSGQVNRHLCGTVHISLCINDVCDINCHGALGDQMEITVKRYVTLHVREVEVYALVHLSAGELNIKYNYLYIYSYVYIYMRGQCTMYIVQYMHIAQLTTHSAQVTARSAQCST